MQKHPGQANSDPSEEDVIEVNIEHVNGGPTQSVEVRRTDSVLEAIAKLTGEAKTRGYFGGEEITDPEATFDDYRIESDARLQIDAPAVSAEVLAHIEKWGQGTRSPKCTESDMFHPGGTHHHRSVVHHHDTRATPPAP